MIYKVNTFYSEPTYFDESENVNAKADAEKLLSDVKAEVLEKEAVRFSVCSTFVNGNDSIWREVLDTDPEETVCKVFDTFTGLYTEVSNKTEALNLNEQKKQEFLNSVGLDKVYEVDEIPSAQQPVSIGTQSL